MKRKDQSSITNLQQAQTVDMYVSTGVPPKSYGTCIGIFLAKTRTYELQL